MKNILLTLLAIVLLAGLVLAVPSGDYAGEDTEETEDIREFAFPDDGDEDSEDDDWDFLDSDWEDLQ